jgi:hypothetical protein
MRTMVVVLIVTSAVATAIAQGTPWSNDVSLTLGGLVISDKDGNAILTLEDDNDAIFTDDVTGEYFNWEDRLDADAYQWRAFEDATSNWLLQYNSGTLMQVSSGGMLIVPTDGALAGIRLGTDVNLYRSSANMLRISDGVTIDSTLNTTGAATFAGNAQAEFVLFEDRSTDSQQFRIFESATAGLLFQYNNGTILELSYQGQLKVPTVGATGGLLIGGDATLYRNTTLSLTTNASLTVAGELYSSGVATSVQDQLDALDARLDAIENP